MSDEPQAAVMPDFADAAGLEALTAAGGRQPSSARSHGDAPKGEASPAIAWPPPETPAQFKALVRQADGVGSMVAGMFVPGVAPLPEKVCDQTADGLWPLAYFYGAGGDKPSKGAVWTYAALAILGLVALHIAQVKAAQSPTHDGKGAE